MAVKKCIIVLGQSNTDLSGDWRGWIAENRAMNLDLVGPGIGPYGTRYHTMPGTWPGYQTVGIQGLTIPELKFLTYYNPSPTGYPTYPCVGRVATTGGGGTVLYHLTAWHPTANALVGGSDASTVTITRKRTGTTHKVTQSVISIDAYGRPSAGAMVVTPAFTNPDPETNDEFTYNIRAVENSPDASTVVGSVCWWSPGPQAAAGSEGTLVVLAAEFNTGTETITSVAHGLANGTRLWVATSGGGGTPYPTTSPAGQLDQFKYVFVVQAATDTFKVSATEGGTPINITAAPSVDVTFRWFTAPAMSRLNGLILKCTAGTANNVGVERIISGVGGAVGTNLTVSVAFPATPQAGDIFEILSPTGSFETLAYWLPYCPYVGLGKQWDTFETGEGAINATSNTITAAGHQMGDGMTITVSSDGAYPSGLAASTTYYVINSNIDAGTFQVAATSTGTAIDIGFSKTFTADAGTDTLTAVAHGLTNGTTLTVSSAGTLPAGLSAGVTYYVVNKTADTLKLSLTLGGAAVDFTDAGTGTHTMTWSMAGVTLTWRWNTTGKYNPFPPGLDYYTYVGGQQFQYDGVSTLEQTTLTRSSGFVPSFGYQAMGYLGEELRILQTSIGGTTLHRQDSARFTLATGVMSSTQIHWSPSDANGIYGLFLARLDRAVEAAAEEGHTLDVRLVVFGQGEGDALVEAWADRYEDNLRTFKAAVRQAIKDRGMTTLHRDRIPWVQPKIVSVPPPNIEGSTLVWPYADTVNDAIVALTEEDPFMETCEVDDLDHRVDPDPVPGHYSGESYAILGGRIFDAWLRIRQLDNAPTDVGICNMALSHIGDAGKVTSLDTTEDTSRQAALCAVYYPIALSTLLERREWSFTSRREALVALDDDAAESGTTEWDYAYSYPRAAAHIIAVHPPEATSDYINTMVVDGVRQVTGDYTPQEFVVEVDTRGRRIIYTDVEDAVIRYAIDTSQTVEFPDTFVQALSWHLASMLAGPIIKDENGRVEAKCIQMTEHYVSKAEEADSKQRRVRPKASVPWITGR